MDIKQKILTSTRIQLEVLAESHYDKLYSAAQDEQIWVYNSSSAFGDNFSKWFEKAMKGMEAGQQLPFAVRRLSDQKIIGSTRYYDINHDHRRLTIGYTWYIPEVWGTGVNTQCKYLLLQNAFEGWQVNRVEFVVDSRNVRSRAAIKKIGATEEGVLRKHMVLKDGYIRDSVVFSMIESEWPAIKLTMEKSCEKIR